MTLNNKPIGPVLFEPLDTRTKKQDTATGNAVNNHAAYMCGGSENSLYAGSPYSTSSATVSCDGMVPMTSRSGSSMGAIRHSGDSPSTQKFKSEEEKKKQMKSRDASTKKAKRGYFRRMFSKKEKTPKKKNVRDADLPPGADTTTKREKDDANGIAQDNSEKRGTDVFSEPKPGGHDEKILSGDK